MDSTSLTSSASKEDLVKEYVGKSLHDVSCPAVVLDLSILRKNCTGMLEAVNSLDCGWRAHIKTHKTTELTRLQIGDGPGPANIVVSTVVEAENIVPLLLEYKSGGRAVNVLYSFPLTSGVVDRLSKVSTALGPNGLSLMIDHPSQLRSVAAIHTKTSIPPLVFIKIDMGTHRAGVIPGTETCSQLISSVTSLAKRDVCILHGLYSHAGHSYSSNSQTAALDYLRQEFEALLVTSEEVHSVAATKLPLVLSVGATPTSNAIRNLLLSSTSSEELKEISALKATTRAIRDRGSEIEIHAGVYPTLDMQQLATHALPEELLSWSSVAITILAEVASLYPPRGKSDSPEALITAGSLALGREPCKAYPGWGILSPWNRTSFALPNTGPEGYSGWQISRISQEHGILSNPGKNDSELSIGQKVRVWPNHACIAGAGYGWYLIVDESREGKEDEIIDVWVRWRGW
ncbi:Bcdsd1 [Botrytis cinerea B05.10]|uniref:D-serine dehydratase n=2 Tax=Botryotinia fuckeliana TaxID=40559 RepID=A0A384JHE5_BOTFB|nr:Bcdsd1 [Botrytis cinerea B05.10]ATZ50015.1 Bcdsd1 [Botrytis cinerea B05.10]EMR84349.1 putative alanine racemase domain protein [Botrytis cinerea BcDW1]